MISLISMVLYTFVTPPPDFCLAASDCASVLLSRFLLSGKPPSILALYFKIEEVPILHALAVPPSVIRVLVLDCNLFVCLLLDWKD